MSNPKEDAATGGDDIENEGKEIIEDSVDDAPDLTEEAESDLTVEEQLDKALEEVNKFKDVALRAEAEMQNIRRRTERDVENAYKYGLEKLIQNLLPVVDGIEKAIESTEQSGIDADDPVIEGFRLCHKLMLDVLERENVEVVDPFGEPFDPNEHEAMTMIENPDMEPNSVSSVVQKGYKLNSRLVRPAMVIVSKAPENQ